MSIFSVFFVLKTFAGRCPLFRCVFCVFQLWFLWFFELKKQCEMTPIQCRIIIAQQQRTHKSIVFYEVKLIYLRFRVFPPLAQHCYFSWRFRTSKQQKMIQSSHHKFKKSDPPNRRKICWKISKKALDFCSNAYSNTYTSLDRFLTWKYPSKWSLRAPLDSSWAPLGVSWAPLGRLLGTSWVILGASGGPLEASWSPMASKSVPIALPKAPQRAPKGPQRTPKRLQKGAKSFPKPPRVQIKKIL